MSTLQSIFNADMKEMVARYRRYYSASNLSVSETWSRKPKAKKSPRDKVLKKLMRLQATKAMNDITSSWG